MRAMILAAGRGERMKPLTDHCPKPLLALAGKPLMVYHIEKLVALGIRDIVINSAWLSEQIQSQIADGSAFGANVSHSVEHEGGLETAGGIIKALPLLGEEPFIVVNGDIWTDYDFAHLPQQLPDSLAHLVFVDNPEHNEAGDFAITHGKVCQNSEPKYTFSGIAVYRPELFAGCKVEKAPLPPLWRRYMDDGLIGGELYHGLWTDVGTPIRLQQLEQQLSGGTHVG